MADYTKHIAVTSFNSHTDGNATTTFSARVYLLKFGEVGWYAADAIKHELMPQVFSDNSGMCPHVTPEWNNHEYLPGQEGPGNYKYWCTIIKSDTAEGLSEKIEQVVSSLKKSIDAVELRNIQVAAEKSKASAIVSALSSIDYIGATSTQISAVAAAVSADERKNTLTIVRHRLSGLTYRKSALKAIADL